MGAYGGMGEASLSLRRTLPIIRPLGGEKWSGEQQLRWLAIPADEWTALTDKEIRIEYSTDGFDTFSDVATVNYPVQDYLWDTILPDDDSPTYQVRVSGGELVTSSGVFMVDNTVPTNVGCLLPEDGESGLPTYIPLRGIEPEDALAGLHAEPYYFQLDTFSSFTSPDLQNSGWLSRNAWGPVLEPGETYYWRVKARDAADPPNESDFCGFTADTEGYGTFSTVNWFQATNIDGTGDEADLRWILANAPLAPGDTIMLDFEVEAVAAPVVVLSLIHI